MYTSIIYGLGGRKRGILYQVSVVTLALPVTIEAYDSHKA
jgi:hypothetical protein